MTWWQQVSSSIGNSLPAFVFVALASSAIALVGAILALVKTAAALRPFSRVKSATDDPGQLLPAVMQTVERAESGMEQLRETFSAHLEESRSSLRNVGIVQYDAFDDVGGRQSFSLCLLDGNRNGVILTYLTGQKSTRSYAVTVRDGKPSRRLGEEESRALQEAVSGPVGEPVTV